MTDLAQLPVDPDEGFPQMFLLAFAGATYGITWYVDIAEQQLPAARVADPSTLIDLAGDGAGGGPGTGSPAGPPRGILVLAVDRRDLGTVTPLLRRRVIPGLTYRAGQLLLVVDQAGIALGNLNGAGSYGSVLSVRVGVAA
jgi:hypothetical protein